MNLDDYRVTYNVTDWERIAEMYGELCVPTGAVRAINALCNEVESNRAAIAELEEKSCEAGALADAQTRELRQRVKVLEETGEYWLDQAALVSEELERNRAAIDELVGAGRAVVDRWATPLWKDVRPTGEFIAALRAAIAKHEPVTNIHRLNESTTTTKEEI